ncbi:MAG: cytochrome c oxidase subunit II [Legionellales bacterium]|nr:cytochrome c oxidase subunit II [Legionellales bacterium]
MQSWWRNAIAVLVTLLLPLPAVAASIWNMPKGVTPISHQIYDIHMITFYVCCAIGVVVFGALFYSIIRYRRSKSPTAANFHEHLWVEIAWTVIPVLILIALAIPATLLLKQIHNTQASSLQIKITGYQWKWKYEYLDEGISFFSNLTTPKDQIEGAAAKGEHYLLEVDNEMVVPTKQKIKLLVTSNDVIHDWWVPELGVKQDGIPGYINENWVYIDEPGTYRGQCGELCGVYHGFMPVVVKAVPQAEFNQWVAAHQTVKQQKAAAKAKAKQEAADKPPEKMTKAALLAIGKPKYQATCGMCHQANGQGLPPTFPALKGSPVATGPVGKNIDILLHGVSGTAMQAFGEQLDDETLASIITYVRDAWGNGEVNQKAGHAIEVQPSEIANARKE